MTTKPDLVALVLSGGNALGSYQAGAWQVLAEQGIEPDWIAAASAGALNGAIICGNPPERRLARLEEFWQPAQSGAAEPVRAVEADTARRTAAAGLTLALGKAGAFVPRRLFGPMWEPFLNPEPASLYDTTPLAATLEQLIDFDLLNRARPRFTALAVDVESGADIRLESGRDLLTSAHLRAACAMLPLFPPVEIEGRLLADAGLSLNLPLDIVLSEARPGTSLLCIALDLLPLAGSRPRDLGDVLCRMQDLTFASQARRAAAAWQAIFDERLARREAGAGDEVASVTLLHLAYADQAEEVSGKAFDYSPLSARARWDAGRRDMARALAQWREGAIETGRPGLTIYRAVRGFSDAPPRLRVWRPTLAPVAG